MPQQKSDDHFTYCDTRNCGYGDCARNHAYWPWNKLIYVDRFEPNEKYGTCEHYIRRDEVGNDLLSRSLS